MRISDWSSDVCSSDLPIVEYPRRRPQMLVPLRPDPACSFRRVGVAMEHDDLRTLRNGRTPDPVHDPARKAVALAAAAPGFRPVGPVPERPGLDYLLVLLVIYSRFRFVALPPFM